MAEQGRVVFGSINRAHFLKHFALPVLVAYLSWGSVGLVNGQMSLSPPFPLLLCFLLPLFLSNALAFPAQELNRHPHHGPAKQNYGDALSKSILFFEGQRSGRLPPNQRMTWRRNSGLSDGSTMHARALTQAILSSFCSFRLIL